MPNLPWKDAIEQVLLESGEAMHYTDIAARVEELGLRTTLGATPANSAATALSVSVRNDADTPFFKAGTGLYGLLQQQTTTTVLPPTGDQSVAGDTIEIDTTVLKALGMYWLRSKVLWKTNPSILGRQQVASDPVNFCNQRGVYLLHDRRDVIYVGRSTERPLGQRLYEHTNDRLSGRWDRFSWFGLLPVSETGELDSNVPEYNGDSIITAFESVLIESLEPPLNRRRGDNLNAIEFMQALDPEIERRQTRELLQQALARVDGT